MPGPLPDPPALRLLKDSARRALNLSDGVNPRVMIPSPPKHLGPEAKKEWRRVTPILEELGLISGLDRACPRLYCQAYGRLVELEMAFEGMVNRRLLDLDVKTYGDAIYAVSHSVTPSGYAQQSVIVQLITRHREQVNRYLMHFGMSPAARARVQPSNYVQPTLPGVEEAPKAKAATGFAKFSLV